MRALAGQNVQSLEEGLQRLGIPTTARQYLVEKIPQWHLGLSGLGREEGRFLRSLAEISVDPGREEFPAFVSGDQKKRPGTALLSGRREQFVRVMTRARAQSLPELAQALEDFLRGQDPLPPFLVKDRAFELGRRTYVMGVVNVTPDSFSDAGQFKDPARAIAHGLALLESGADFLDVGGASSRPGAVAVSEDEELRRVLPVIEGLSREQAHAVISIDTTQAFVAERALDAGASWVNDIRGFGQDARMASVVQKAQASCCLMHMQGTPATMQENPHYEDVVAEVYLSLRDSLRRATDAGISPQRICVDPGIGFGKTLAHNLTLLRRLGDFRSLGVPVLVGTSRKAWIGALTGGKPATGRLWGTVGSVAALAAMGTADIVRVHDVAECKDALSIADAIRSAPD